VAVQHQRPRLANFVSFHCLAIDVRGVGRLTIVLTHHSLLLVIALVRV
jgi:hypothetical protein